MMKSSKDLRVLIAWTLNAGDLVQKVWSKFSDCVSEEMQCWWFPVGWNKGELEILIFRNSIKVALGKRTGNDRPITTTPNHQITKCIPCDTIYKDKDKHKEKDKDKDKYNYYNTNTNNTTATSHQITKCIPCDIDLLLPLFDDDDNKSDTDDDDVDD